MSLIPEKISQWCSYRPSTKFTEGLSQYQILDKLIDLYNQVIDYIESFQSQIDLKESILNITNNRKLDENGDFTGTWFGDTYNKIKTDIASSLLLSQSMIDAINSRESIGLIYDGKTFPYLPDDEAINITIDGGTF